VVARSVLVVAQLAVSVMLLVGALLLIRAYERLQQVDIGLHPDRVLTFGIVIPRAHQEDAAAKRTLETIEDRLAAMPGAERVEGSALPLAAAGSLWGFTSRTASGVAGRDALSARRHRRAWRSRRAFR
jgi:hypothetical protein